MPELPKKIGRYQIDRMLGAGAMGYVYLARDPELDREVAIKTVRFSNLAPESRETYVERFKNEARAAAKLHQPNIVQVYDVGQDETLGPYLVFEYVPGASLKQLLASRGPLSPEQICLFADELADALAAAHAVGIIHRDIKPDNLLVTERGRPKLADFGVARFPNADLTREGQFLGTPCYAAPETLREGRYGPETDLFSLASMLYECVSGRRAFPGDDAIAVAHKVIHDTPRPPSEVAEGALVPPAVDTVLMRALAKSPAERFTTPHELARALRAAYQQAGKLPRRVGEEDVTEEVVLERAERIIATRPASEGSLAFVAVLLGIVAVGVSLVVAFDRAAAPALDEDASLTEAGVDTARTSRVRDASVRARRTLDVVVRDASLDPREEPAFDGGLRDAQPRDAELSGPEPSQTSPSPSQPEPATIDEP